MTDFNDNMKNGGNERAQESAAPGPIGQDCSAGDILQNELQRVSEVLQSLQAKCETYGPTIAELQRRVSVLEGATQHLSTRQKREEKFRGRLINFFRHLFNVRFLKRCWNESDDCKKGPIDARSGLTFPEEKTETFGRCWRMLYVDVPHAAELDKFFDLLRACCTANDMVRTIRQFMYEYSSVRGNKFLRSREGITQLTTLLDNPDDSLKYIQSLVRKIRKPFSE
jgi:hypothetical protein